MRRYTNWLQMTSWTYNPYRSEIMWRYAFHEELTWDENLYVMELMLAEGR